MLSNDIDTNVSYNDRKVLGGLELDIYYPDYSVGIEYQGNYWHSLPENVIRDDIKRGLCENKGIKLIEVWDDEFLKDTNNVYNKIKNEILDHIKDI